MATTPDIFLVEDDLYYNRVLRNAFEKNNFAVRAFTNSNDYLNAIEQQTPDVVILDYEIDHKNGIDLLVATKEKNSTAKVIMMSTLQKPEIIKEANRQGAMAFLHKDHDLFRKLMSYVKKAGHEHKEEVVKKQNVFLLILFVVLAIGLLLWINFPHLERFLVPRPVVLLSSCRW